uniref:Bm7781, isoform b n=1 Tax=Brugia malayi TaxID=6279 RepID=A0A1I9G830_BRUMA|nr:Bm7781, isoform b [Brugia malayi]
MDKLDDTFDRLMSDVRVIFGTTEHNTVISTSEQSTDSTVDSISRPAGKHWNSKNVRDRYRIIRQQYPEVIKRLDRLKMETHNLDWHQMHKAPLVEVDENAHRIPSRKQKNSVAVGIDSNFTANSKNVEPISDSRPSSKMNHSYTLPDRMGMSSENSSVKNDVYYGEDFVNSLRRQIGPYRGPALAKYKHMMQHTYGYNSSTGYQSNECQQLNEFAQDSRQNHEGEHSFENRDGSSGSDSEMERIHNKQEMARQAAAIRYDSLPLTAPNEFYYFGVIQLPQVSDF